MACDQGCPDEDVQSDEASPGPIANAEVLCRAAYGKKAHYNSAGVKPTFIRDADLLDGCLSVWRRRDGSAEELDDIKAQGSAPEGNSLWDLFGATAEDIRAVRAPSRPETQVLHAYDDCRIDEDGGKHPKHAVLSICNAFDPQGLSKHEPIYAEIRDELFRLLRKNVVWALPMNERT